MMWKPSETWACATGDCPHGTVVECLEDILALADDMATELEYYKARRRFLPPRHVPTKVRVLTSVAWAGGVLDVLDVLGGVECESDAYGGVTIRVEAEGVPSRRIPLRPDQFEPLTWRENPAFREKP